MTIITLLWLTFPIATICFVIRGGGGRGRKKMLLKRAAKTSGGGYFNVVTDENRTVDYFGQSSWCDLSVAKEYKKYGVEALKLAESELDDCNSFRENRVFCTRTLNLRSIKVIGYDMDYTLVHYQWEKWEAKAYACTKEVLQGYGFPVHDLEFNPSIALRGLVIDKEQGNLIKIDRHGFVRRAMHGSTYRLSEVEIDQTYGRTIVDLRQVSRYTFLNTLFSVSEAVLYAQLVAKLDSGALFKESRPPFDANQCASYADLFRAVSKALARAHTAQTSKLKAAVAANPEFYAQRDPIRLRATLADQRLAGKKLALITNSGWSYTNIMMRFVLDDPNWRNFFDLVFVSARKPSFFTTQILPCYELIVDSAHIITALQSKDKPLSTTISIDDPLLRETTQAKEGGVYCGGSARFVEKLFAVTANEVLYVGDHIFMDANAVKATMRWRTALVVQELDNELKAYRAETEDRARTNALLVRKQRLGRRLNTLRCQLRRLEQEKHDKNDHHSLQIAQAQLDQYRQRLVRILNAMATLDELLFPAIRNSGATFNKYWGFLCRAGYNDKSHFQRQIEKYADIYTAKVTNFHAYTPYHYFRTTKQPLPHDDIMHDEEDEFSSEQADREFYSRYFGGK
mmetsp:Transcript_11156/g.13941  ORF Transcript_11156/g.13941 Transcript_11156/m.13941 type:complete len:626 (+) Transcript_11156:97-1974(+)